MREETLLREVSRNLQVRPVQTALIMFLSFVCSVGSFGASFTQIGALNSRQIEMIERGSNVWRVHSGQPFESDKCERLRRVQGIRAIGIQHSRFTAAISEIADARVTVLRANADYLDIVWGSEIYVPLGAGVGAGLHRKLGLRAGTSVSLKEQGSPFGRSLQIELDEVFRDSRRLKGSGQMLAVRVDPPELVRECLIEAKAGTNQAVERLLFATFSRGTSITKIYSWGGEGPTPSNQMKNRMTLWTAVAFPTILLVLYLVLQFSRREEWALYHILGIRQGQQLRMHCYEYLATVWVPYALGLALVVAAGTYSEVQMDSSFLSIFSQDVLRVGLLLLTVPAALAILLRQDKSLEWLKGE